MVKGLYISATNLNTNIKKLGVISNNLSNIETTGYKKDNLELESFNARLLKRINGSNSFAEMGDFKVESEPYGDELNISTKRGFFTFQTKNGLHNSKSGRITVDEDGFVRSSYKLYNGEQVRGMGSYLLSLGQRINVGQGAGISITADGSLEGGGKTYPIVKAMNQNQVGTISAGVRGYAVRTDFEQGNIVRTDNKTDFALKGEGFFEVVGIDGKDYLTRFGALTLNADNELMTIDGSRLKGLKGNIVLKNGDFSINSYGEIIQNGELVDKVSLVNFTNKADIFKVGNSFYRQRQNLMGEKNSFEGDVIQGHIERSNVDAVTEMIKMIELNRNYESSQKVVNTIDEMLAKSANDLGRL